MSLILDTGPLVAFLNRRDPYQEWVSLQWSRIKPPLHTCESVLSEACFLLTRHKGGCGAVLDLVQRGVIQISFQMADHMESISRLMNKYSDIPMSLADACLVRMSELDEHSQILTIDQDFKTYRRHGRQTIPLVTPFKR